MGFFLYLATILLSKTESIFKNPNISGIETQINILFVYLVPLAFLYLGFMIGLSTSAMGASTVIGLTKKYGKKGGLYGAYGAARLANRAIGSEWAEKRGLKEKLTKQAATPYPGKTVLGKAAWSLGTLGAAPTYWALRRGIGEATLRMTEAGRKDVGTAQDKYKGTTAASKTAAMRDVRLGSSHRIAALTQAIEEKQIDDIKKLGISNEEITNIGKAALRVHPDAFKKIRNAFPHLAEQMGKGFSSTTQEQAGLTFKNVAERNQYKDSIATKITAKLKPADIPGMDESSLYTNEARRAVHNFWTGSHVSAAGQAFGKKFIDDFQGVADKLGKGWYEKNNSGLGTYLTSSTARGLGIGFEEKKP